MNENFIASLFDSSDDDDLMRSIDRYSDGECSAAEEAELFDRLDATPGAWKQCALALAEARDLRISLAGVGRSRTVGDESTVLRSASHSAEGSTVALASPGDATVGSCESRTRRVMPRSAVALGLALSFAAGFAVAPRSISGIPSLVNVRPPLQSDANPTKTAEATDGQGSRTNGGDLIASGSRTRPDTSSASGPEIVNVVYRPSDDAEETSAPLPVYKSDEDWARALDVVVRQSEADLADRRAQLLVQGADLERQIVLHPVATEQGEMLLPVETFQIVPVSLNSFH